MIEKGKASMKSLILVSQPVQPAKPAMMRVVKRFCLILPVSFLLIYFFFLS